MSAREGKRRNHLLWLGPLLTAGAAISYFTYFARFPSLRDFPWVNLPLVLLGLALSAVGLWRPLARRAIYRGRWLGALGLAGSSLLASAFVLYIFGISTWMPAPSAKALTLDRAPDFTLEDQDGRPVHLADFRGRKLILTFYRGHW